MSKKNWCCSDQWCWHSQPNVPIFFSCIYTGWLRTIALHGYRNSITVIGLFLLNDLGPYPILGLPSLVSMYATIWCSHAFTLTIITPIPSFQTNSKKITKFYKNWQYLGNCLDHLFIYMVAFFLFDWIHLGALERCWGLG